MELKVKFVEIINTETDLKFCNQWHFLSNFVPFLCVGLSQVQAYPVLLGSLSPFVEEKQSHDLQQYIFPNQAEVSHTKQNTYNY